MWPDMITAKLHFDNGPIEFVGRGYLSKWEAVQACRPINPTGCVRLTNGKTGQRMTDNYTYTVKEQG